MSTTIKQKAIEAGDMVLQGTGNGTYDEACEAITLLIEALTLPTPTREEVAWFAAEYFGQRPLAQMAQHRADLRLKMREDSSFDVNEPTQDDCLLFADAILQLIGKGG